ncbi:MAG TPA: fumarylacetoacetate hydrolase family protein [Ensifer sp.]|nr:fumarylacetoacetate hydrolase family protein [Ensifer sp.]
MKLFSYKRDGVSMPGVLRGGDVIDLRQLDADMPSDITAFLAAGPAAMERVAGLLSKYDGPVARVEDCELAPVVPRPGKILCLGLNYVEHAKEGGMPIPKDPVVFLRTTTSLLGPGQPCRVSPLSEQLDFEAELAIVIGSRARGVLREAALSHVAGYSVFNDLTYRDFQFRGPQWTMGKNFDGTGAFGPCLVTADELPAGADGLRITTRINGELVQNGNTSDMIFKVPEVIEILSSVMTLEPGDVIITGTPAGVGAGRKPPLWLKAGDVCEVEIECIGKITTHMVAA